jgi:purine nucleosidase
MTLTDCSSARRQVLFIHDGGVDDYLALALLLTMEHIEILAVVVTPADCYIKPAVSATRKILDLVGRSDIPVAESTVRGLNPFPRIFRRDAFSVDHFPILNEKEGVRTQLVAQRGQAFVAELLAAAQQPVTILETGPLTTLAEALLIDPSISEKIREIIWMGGAFHVPGNVDKVIEGGQDGSAEWNVYFDPEAAAQVFQTAIPLTLCPLDLTNRVPITSQFVLRLCRQRRHPLSELAAMCYALVLHQDYFAWDVLTCAYLGRPELFSLRSARASVITEGVSQGRTVEHPQGRPISILQEVDLEGFYSYLFAQLSR